MIELQFREDFLAAFVEVRLKELWEVNIASIQMTANLEPSKIITHSDLINQMHMMMAWRTVKLQASAEVPEV